MPRMQSVQAGGPPAGPRAVAPQVRRGSGPQPDAVPREVGPPLHRGPGPARRPPPQGPPDDPLLGALRQFLEDEDPDGNGERQLAAITELWLKHRDMWQCSSGACRAGDVPCRLRTLALAYYGAFPFSQHSPCILSPSTSSPSPPASVHEGGAATGPSLGAGSDEDMPLAPPPRRRPRPPSASPPHKPRRVQPSRSLTALHWEGVGIGRGQGIVKRARRGGGRGGS